MKRVDLPTRLILVAILSPILALLVVALMAVVLPLTLFPAAGLGIGFWILGFSLYGWAAGRFAGRGSGLAVGVGLAASWGLLFSSVPTKSTGAGIGVALVTWVAIIVAAVTAEATAWRRRVRGDGGPHPPSARR